MSAYIITRIHVGDYDAWRPMLDQDRPRAREHANHVFILLEFATVEDADESRRRPLESGVLGRFADKHGPNVVVEAGAETTQ